MIRRRIKPFSTFLDKLDKEISKTAARQYIPGYTPEEIKAEMVECLWKAYTTYDRSKNIKLEQYWWAIWMNRKSNILKASYAAMRDVRLTLHVDPRAFSQDFPGEGDEGWWMRLSQELERNLPDESMFIIPECPSDEVLHKQVWVLLATGYTPSDVMRYTAISKKQYYEVTRDLRVAWEEAGLFK